MADEFTAGMCAENWWMHPSQINFGSSPVCSSNIINNMEIHLWPNDHLDKKTRASDETAPSANSDHEGSIIFYDSYKTSNQDSYADGSLLSINNTLENIVDNDLSSSITQDWNHTILHGDSKTSECNHQGNFLGSINSSSDYRQNAFADNLSEINKDWSAMKFSTINKDISFIDVYKAPTGSSSYGYASSLIKNLFDSETHHQDSIFGNQYSMEYPTLSDICQEKFNDQFPSSSLLKPSVPVLPINQPLITHLIPNNSSCNASNDDGLFSSVQSQFLSPKFDFKLNCANLSVKSNSERSREMMSTEVKNSITEPALKRQRIETPSSLPTFKVRKEKLGDRVTGLQQLVSPFGKTDTASVLHEAIEYIKLLHDQVTVLIAPYYKGGSPIDQHDDQCVIDVKGTNQSLKNWGLCIVPISSTFQLTTADFWTPTFGGSFK